MGKEGQFILNIFPELEEIIGAQRNIPADLDPTEMQIRFINCFSSFARTLATQDHKIVLFIDDW